MHAERGAMLRIVFCLRRRDGMTPEEFRRYWFEVHAPLVRQHRTALRIARYVQLHTEPDALTAKLRAFRHSPEPYDGVAEVWYRSREALEAVAWDPAARVASRALRADEQRFIDLARSPIWIGVEREIALTAIPEENSHE